jgi:hypothetical protein
MSIARCSVRNSPALILGILPTASSPGDTSRCSNFRIVHQTEIAWSSELRTGFPFNVTNDQQQLVGPPGSQRFPEYFSLNLFNSKSASIFSDISGLCAAASITLPTTTIPTSSTATSTHPNSSPSARSKDAPSRPAFACLAASNAKARTSAEGGGGSSGSSELFGSTIGARSPRVRSELQAVEKIGGAGRDRTDGLVVENDSVCQSNPPP